MANSAEVFFKSLTELKLDDIRKSARLSLKVALAGTEEELEWLQQHFREGARDDGDLRMASDTLRPFPMPLDEEAIKQINACTFSCVSPAASERIQSDKLTITAPIYTIGTEGEWAHFKREILDARQDLHLALGRNLPGLRRDVVEYLIVSVACINAEIAVASAAMQKVPWLPVFGTVALGDTILLTKNQIMLLFRLAGACGLPIDIVHRKGEVVSTVGSAIGWRTLAREGSGMIPAPFAPFAIALKGAIAYAGTYTLGRAIAHFFMTGHRLEKSEERRLYKESLEAGRTVATRTAERLFSRIHRPAFLRRRKRGAAEEPVPEESGSSSPEFSATTMNDLELLIAEGQHPTESLAPASEPGENGSPPDERETDHLPEG